MEVFELTPSPRPKKWRSGVGTVAYSDSGELFINSELIGMSAMTAFLCTSADGVGIIASANKVLVPVSWAISERPHMRDDIERLAHLAKESVDSSV